MFKNLSHNYITHYSLHLTSYIVTYVLSHSNKIQTLLFHAFFFLQTLLYDEFKVTHLLIGIICLASVIVTWTYEEKDLIVLGMQRWNWLPQKTD